MSVASLWLLAVTRLATCEIPIAPKRVLLLQAGLVCVLPFACIIATDEVFKVTGDVQDVMLHCSHFPVEGLGFRFSSRSGA